MDYISGYNYTLHQYIQTSYVNDYESLYTTGMFLLCPGNLEVNNTPLYVHTSKSYWLKWPVNIDECMVYLSVEGFGSIFERPDIFIDDKGRYCFDAIGLLDKKNIGYVNAAPYSPRARVDYTSRQCTVGRGGVWWYRGRRKGEAYLHIILSDAHIELNGKYIYCLDIEGLHEEFVKVQDLEKLILDFMDAPRTITQSEFDEFLNSLPVHDYSVYYYESESDANKDSKAEHSSDGEAEEHPAVSEKLEGLDLTRLLTLDNGYGVLLFLNDTERGSVPGRLVFTDGKKEKTIQVLIRPKTDCLLYKDVRTGTVRVLNKFEVENNLIKIDVTKWLQDNDIDYAFLNAKQYKNAFKDNYVYAGYDLDFRNAWPKYIESEYSSIADKGCYLVIAADTGMSIHEIIYQPTKEEMREYIKREYGGTSWEEIAKTPFEELTEPHMCLVGHRMGSGKSRLHYQVYNCNLTGLYFILDCVEVYDKNHDPVRLSDYLRKATTESAIRKVIDIYNDSFDNWW